MKIFNCRFLQCRLKLCHSLNKRFWTSDDPIKSIRARYDSDDLVLEDDESKLLEEFSNYIISKDPDIIEFRNNDLKYT